MAAPSRLEPQPKPQIFALTDYALITKECNDGYCLKGGRNIEVGTIMIIEGTADTTDASIVDISVNASQGVSSSTTRAVMR